MTDKPEQTSEAQTIGNMVYYRDATPQMGNETTLTSQKNDLLPAGEISPEGVGGKSFSPSTGVAIYSGEVPEKKSNAYGVSKKPATCAGVGCEVCDAARAEKIAEGAR